MAIIHQPELSVVIRKQIRDIIDQIRAADLTPAQEATMWKRLDTVLSLEADTLCYALLYQLQGRIEGMTKRAPAAPKPAAASKPPEPPKAAAPPKSITRPAPKPQIAGLLCAPKIAGLLGDGRTSLEHWRVGPPPFEEALAEANLPPESALRQLMELTEPDDDKFEAELDAIVADSVREMNDLYRHIKDRHAARSAQ